MEAWTARHRDLAAPAAAMAALALAAAVGWVLTATLEPRAFDSWLGVPNPPLFLTWSPNLELGAAAAAVALAAGVVSAPLLADQRVGPVRFAVGAFALGLALRLVLATARGGVDAWTAPFGAPLRGGNEYLPALPGVEGLGLAAYLDRFAEIMPTLPVHPSAHPPGTIVLLHLLGIDGAGGMAALTIVSGATTVPLTYALGRLLLAERHARVAALLLVFSPAALIYGVTSADAMFAMLGLIAAVALAASGRLARPLGAAALALASLFSWALLAVGAWAAALAWLRHGPGSALRLATWCAAALVAVYGLLAALTGFDPIGALGTAGELYRRGLSDVRPYWYWILGSPAAFLISTGLAITWFAAKALAARQAPALALAGIIAVAAVLGFSKAETERIWLFMGPLACVAAAPFVADRRLKLVLGLMAAQALATELLFFTVW